MTNKSIWLGTCTLLGLLIGLWVHKIMVGTFIGLACGYLITFWLPYLKRQFKHKNR